MVVVEVLGGVVAASLLTALGLSVKIVREYQRIVLFRLGRSVGIKGPGLVLINPVTDRTSLVDLRERFLEIPQQTAITQDNASISIDFIIFYKVVDPAMSVLEVQNFAVAAQNVAATTLRSVVGDMVLDDVLSTAATNSGLRLVQEYIDGSLSYSSFASSWQSLLTSSAQQYATANHVDLSKY